VSTDQVTRGVCSHRTIRSDFVLGKTGMIGEVQRGYQLLNSL